MNTHWHPLKLSGSGPDISRPFSPLKPEKVPGIKNIGRLAWIIPAAILLSLPFIREGDYSILVPACAAAGGCLLAMASVGYSLTSFVSIVALTHLLFFPLAVWGNLLLPVPIVRWDLWVSSDLAMWGCMVGLLALALGAFISGLLTPATRKSFSGSRSLPLPSTLFNLILILLIVPVFLIQWKLGLYFHSGISDYRLENLSYVNLIEMLTVISQGGIFLQTFRYCRTRSPWDGYWAIAFCVLHVVSFMPSGRRAGALGFMPLLFLAYLSWDFNAKRKIIAVLVTVAIVPALIYGMGKYRGEKDVALLSFHEKFESSLNSPLTFFSGEGKGQAPLVSIINRFSDYVAAGRIIADTPKQIPYRGSEQLDKLWQIFVPGFLQLIPDRINLLDGADLCDRYGVTKSFMGMGTSPAMIIGDLFSRWGWIGIVLVMALTGFILRQIDLHMMRRWDTFTILFYLFFGRHVTLIVSTTLVNLVTIFTRELLVMSLLAYLLARLSLKSSHSNPYIR
jgi:hypothetical protein